MTDEKDSEYWEKRGIDAGKEEWLRLCSRAKSEEMSMLVDNMQINKYPPWCQFMDDTSMAWLKKHRESLPWYKKIKLFFRKKNGKLSFRYKKIKFPFWFFGK